LPFIIDPAHPRPFDEVVRQYLVPEIDHLLRLREEAVPADVEAEAFILDRATDAADIDGIALDHRHRIALLGEEVSRRKARRPRSDDRHIHGLIVPLHQTPSAFHGGVMPPRC
jgi:uncharacterized small protein (DUF1192 family)